MWPLVAHIVNEPKLGTAYGVMTIIQNLGMAGFSFMNDCENDHTMASAANEARLPLGNVDLLHHRLLRNGVCFPVICPDKWDPTEGFLCEHW